MTEVDEVGPNDAPCWYSAEEASAWADGYNAAKRDREARIRSVDQS
jgi:hypothetical protein